MSADACDTVGIAAQHKQSCCISFQNKEKNPVHFFFFFAKGLSAELHFFLKVANLATQRK